MNKKMSIYSFMLSGLMIATLLVWDVSLSPAQEPVAARMGQKLLRGTANLTTAWVEIPKQIYLHAKRGNPVIGPFVGLFDGIGMTFTRINAGVYEVITFPVPLPKHYQPVLQPAYVWEAEPEKRAQDGITFF